MPSMAERWGSLAARLLSGARSEPRAGAPSGRGGQPGGTGPDPSAAASTEAVFRRIELLVTQRLDGLLSGDHLGLLPSTGTELAEGRPYEPGDDARKIDWNLSARMASTHVRDTEADRELTTWIVADRSPSQRFGTASCEKSDLVLAATGALGFLAARGANRVGLLVSGGDTLVRVPPAAGRAAVHVMLRTVASVLPDDAPDQAALGRQRSRPEARGPLVPLAAALDALARMARRHGLVVVVSDFLEDGWQRPLGRLAQRHQTLAIVTTDPREHDLPDVGLLTVVDPETGRRLEVQTSSPVLRRRYAEAAAQRRQALHRSLRAAGADPLELRTDRDWVLDIVRHVLSGRRHRLGHAGSVR